MHNEDDCKTMVKQGLNTEIRMKYRTNEKHQNSGLQFLVGRRIRISLLNR
jgi:hypothetical protein